MATMILIWSDACQDTEEAIQQGTVSEGFHQIRSESPGPLTDTTKDADSDTPSDTAESQIQQEPSDSPSDGAWSRNEKWRKKNKAAYNTYMKGYLKDYRRRKREKQDGDI